MRRAGIIPATRNRQAKRPLASDTVEMESGFRPTSKPNSRAAATRSCPETSNFGGYQAIMWDAKNRVYWGASEMRKDGWSSRLLRSLTFHSRS